MLLVFIKLSNFIQSVLHIFPYTSLSFIEVQLLCLVQCYMSSSLSCKIF